MKKNIFLTILTFFVLPHVVFAGFTSLNPSTPKPVVGDEFYVQFNLNHLNSDNSDPMIKDYNACIIYDPEALEYISASWTITAVPFDTSVPGRICFNKEDNGRDWSAKVSPFDLKFKALKAGNTHITVTHNGSESHYRDGNHIPQTFSGTIVNCVEPSSDTAIGSLGIKGYTIHPTFSKTHYEYYLTVEPEVTNVFVDAKTMNSKQTITGAGYHTLEYGLNIVHVIVHAQDGSTREYRINVTRTDNRNGDTSLRLLNVSDTIIKYEEGKTYYEAIVSRSVESVLIDARPNDKNATLLGTGRKKLEIGENTFELTLQTKKNDVPVEKIYTVKITRSNEELEKIIQSSKLKSLTINNLGVDLSNDKKLFYTTIFNSASYLYLEPKAESQTAEVSITGNDELKDGFNEISIVVTENNEEKTEYKIIVYKLPEAKSINNLNYIASTDGDMYYIADANATNTLTASQLRYLNNYNYKLYYNAVDSYNALLYQILIENPDDAENLEVSFVKQEDSTPTYKSTLKEGIEVMVFVGDKYPDNQAVKIYTYNEKGKYKLLTDGVKVQNGYINFKTNGDAYYVLTTMSLIRNEGPVTAFINQYKMYLLGGIAGLVLFILLIKVIKNQKAKKGKNEPLY